MKYNHDEKKTLKDFVTWHLKKTHAYLTEPLIRLSVFAAYPKFYNIDRRSSQHKKKHDIKVVVTAENAEKNK